MFEQEKHLLVDLIHSDYRVSDIGLIALGGSHAYGLATENSDVDLRGFAYPNASDILLGQDFEQIQTMNEVDACIYSLAKTCKLLVQCNPNIVELLGLDKESILLETTPYRTMRDNPQMFLSKRAAHTFGGYATAQLRRIQNAMARDSDAKRLAQGALRSMQATLATLPVQYPNLNEKATFSLNLSDEENPRVLVNMHVENAPASELSSFARELDSARKSAETIGKNRRKESSKLAKHASHLIRLLHMGTEILQGQPVQTKRIEDAQLLLDLKNGLWLTEDENGIRTYDDAFWDLLNEAQSAFEYAEANSELPEQADTGSMQDFLAGCHRLIVTGEGIH